MTSATLGARQGPDISTLSQFNDRVKKQEHTFSWEIFCNGNLKQEMYNDLTVWLQTSHFRQFLSYDQDSEDQLLNYEVNGHFLFLLRWYFWLTWFHSTSMAVPSFELKILPANAPNSLALDKKNSFFIFVYIVFFQRKAIPSISNIGIYYICNLFNFTFKLSYGRYIGVFGSYSFKILYVLV